MPGPQYSDSALFSMEELNLAARNHSLPSEALRYALTPPGLHYVLTHFDIPEVEAQTWHLGIGGLVQRPLALTLDDLRRMPAVTLGVVFECAGNGRAFVEPRLVTQPWLLEAVGAAEWTGVRLRSLLEEAGVLENTVEILFSALDRGVQSGIEQDYERSLSVADAVRDEVILAYAMNGVPLPPQHGYPLRLIVPGWYGMAHVKWLSRITAIAEPFEGPQQRFYRYRRSQDDAGVPVTRMRVRALMVPPGIPEFLTRTRHLSKGRHLLRGRAWSGNGAIRSVDVSADGGATWSRAVLEAAPSAFMWSAWHYEWDAAPGTYELLCRATGARGETQPLEPEWNVRGVENNAVQRLRVVVKAG
jgi:sulfane dehydrogenase subunit SoxC